MFSLIVLLSRKISFLFTSSKIYVYTLFINFFFIFFVLITNVGFSSISFDFLFSGNFIASNAVKHYISSNIDYVLSEMHPRMPGVATFECFVYLGEIECAPCVKKSLSYV